MGTPRPAVFKVHGAPWDLAQEGEEVKQEVKEEKQLDVRMAGWQGL